MTLSDEFSNAVAEAANNDAFDELSERLAEIADGVNPKDALSAFNKAVIYSIDAHLPGDMPDSFPSYYPDSGNIKECLLNEYDMKCAVDNDPEWDELRGDLELASSEAYKNGFSVDLPDGYILSLEIYSCAEICSLNGVDIPFANQKPVQRMGNARA